MFGIHFLGYLLLCNREENVYWFTLFKINLPSLATHRHCCFPTQPPGRDPTSFLKASTVLTKPQVGTWISSSPPLRICKIRPSFYLLLKFIICLFLSYLTKQKYLLQELFLKSGHKRKQLTQGVFFFLFFSFFRLCSRHAEVSGSGIEPVPLQWQCRTPKSLCHKRTPLRSFWNKIFILFP